MAILIITYLLYKQKFLFNILIISIILYIIGLKEYSFFKILFIIYEGLFSNTRNGLFFGTIFVYMGLIFAKKRIILNNKIAIIGFIFSMLMMFFEIFLLRHYSYPKDYNMLLFLIPVSFFLFYLFGHLNLEDKNIYKDLRNVGLLIYFLHLLIYYFMDNGFKYLRDNYDYNILKYRNILTVILTIIIAFIINYLSKKKKYSILKYLYT